LLRRLLANLLLAAGAVAATVALAEVASRRLLPQWAPENGSRTFWGYDELLGWSHRPGASGVHRHPDFAARVEINAQGLRDRDYPEARVPGRCRMLVVGDSFTWGFGVQREEIWHERIEQRHPDWEIVNAGVAGYATDQELLYLERRGLALRPDVVLLLFHPNDLLENAEHATSGYYKPYFERRADGALELRQVPVPAGSLEQRVDRWLHFRTYLLYRLYHARKFIAAAREERAAQAAAEEPREARLRERRRAEPRPEARDKYDVDLALTLELLGRIDALVRERGARFLVAIVPFSSASRPGLEEGLRARGIAYVGLDPAFRRQRDVRFPGDPHWTPHGHAIAADAVETFLVGEGALGACAPRSNP
jgi:GDSL-like lipase/acylhydrolase family protein